MRITCIKYAYKTKMDQACSIRKVHFKYEIIFKEDFLKLYLIYFGFKRFIFIAGQSTDCRRFRCAAEEYGTTHDDTSSCKCSHSIYD